MINKYPYTDFNEYNLDWIISEIKTLHKDWDDFKVVNTIHFEGEWDITDQYQAWSLVSDNNIGYISVQPVPAGVDINNTDYWKLVADYSVLMLDIQARVAALENDVDRLNIVTSDRKFVLVGDSYGMRDPNNNWCKYFADNYAGYCVYEARSGYGFGTSSTFNDIQYTIAGTMTAAEREAITDVVVMGGWNDAKVHKNGLTIPQLRTKIYNFISSSRTLFPNCRVNIGFIGWQMYYAGQPVADGVTYTHLREVENGYTSINSPYVNILSNMGSIMKSGAIVMDNTYFHPNTEGSKRIYYTLLQELFGTGALSDYYYILTSTAGFTAGPAMSGVAGALMVKSDIDTITIKTMEAYPINVSKNHTSGLNAGNLLTFSDDYFPIPTMDANDLYGVGTIVTSSEVIPCLVAITGSNKRILYIPAKTGQIDGQLRFEFTVPKNVLY